MSGLLPSPKQVEAIFTFKCAVCGREIKWFNGFPLKGFCWGTAEDEHGEYSIVIPTINKTHNWVANI